MSKKDSPYTYVCAPRHKLSDAEESLFYYGVKQKFQLLQERNYSDSIAYNDTSIIHCAIDCFCMQEIWWQNLSFGK